MKIGGFKLPWLAVILIVAFVLRLVVVLAFPSVFAFETTGAIQGSEAYDTYARNLLATGVYGRVPGTPDAAIPPLYSYALSLVYALIGRGHFQVALFHILLDLASIIMIVDIGKRLLPQGETAGLLAGLFYAVYPYLIFQNLTLIDTPIFMFLLNAFILLMIMLRERPKLDRGALLLAALGGLVLGLSTLTRPITPPLAILVGVWFLFRLNLAQSVVRLLPVATVSILILSVWIARNYTVYHAFVPMTTTSGANFWQGNSEFTVPYFRAGYDVQWTSPTKVTAKVPNSREADAELFALGFQYLRSNPDKIPDLLWTKFLVYWSIDITPRRNPVGGVVPRLDYNGNVIASTDSQGTVDLSGLPPGDPVAIYSEPLFDQIGRWVQRLYYGALFLLAVAGVVLTFRAWRNVSLLWFVQISMTIVYLIFHPSTRYRVPTDPLLFLFSAAAIVMLWQRVRPARFRREQTVNGPALQVVELNQQ